MFEKYKGKTIVFQCPLREGDSLIVSELDRLGRNKADTLKELQYFKDHKIRVMVLELPTSLM
ncbi:MAG: recombinase family protein, partial [Suipraeoptans sp.]